MILLDTQVLSEPLRHVPEPRVIEWTDDQAMADGCIAAIAVTPGFAVATRDTGPLETAGVAVINPWLG